MSLPIPTATGLYQKVLTEDISATISFLPDSKEVTGTATLIIVSNSSRQAWLITHNSGSAIYISGTTAINTGSAYPLSAGRSIIDNMPGVYLGNVYAKTITGTADIRYIEVS